MNDEFPDDAIQVVEHTADWALRIRGADLTELFSRAAVGMARLLAGDLSAVPLDHTRTVTLESLDAESLLVDWLGELAYWAERDGLVFPEIRLRHVEATEMTGTVRGGRAPELQKHIKAVTYHDLAICETAQGLEVTVVFDV
jgi:SHS2 domain-containing protein